MKTTFNILLFFVIFIVNPCKGNTLFPMNNLLQEEQFSDTTIEDWKKIAERERMIAKQKSAEARIQKEIADRNTLEAMNHKKIADLRTSEAMKNKVLADQMTVEAMKQRELADQQAIEVKNCQVMSEQRINELNRELEEVKIIIEKQRLIIENCQKKK